MVYSINFKNKVLNPQKIIIIIEKSKGRDLYKHFSTQGTPKEEVINYKTIKGLNTIQIWLLINNNSLKEIIKEYKYIKSKGLYK